MKAGAAPYVEIAANIHRIELSRFVILVAERRRTVDEDIVSRLYLPQTVSIRLAVLHLGCRFGTDRTTLRIASDGI
ncbi:hypothetical protein, partial [Ralstonia solanacearum]